MSARIVARCYRDTASYRVEATDDHDLRILDSAGATVEAVAFSRLDLLDGFGGSPLLTLDTVVTGSTMRREPPGLGHAVIHVECLVRNFLFNAVGAIYPHGIVWEFDLDARDGQVAGDSSILRNLFIGFGGTGFGWGPQGGQSLRLLAVGQQLHGGSTFDLPAALSTPPLVHASNRLAGLESQEWLGRLTIRLTAASYTTGRSFSFVVERQARLTNGVWLPVLNADDTPLDLV